MPAPKKPTPAQAILEAAQADAEAARTAAVEEAEKMKEAAQADAEAILADARQQAEEILAGANVDGSASEETAEYRVVNVGASYCLPGQPNSRRFAIKGTVITLDGSEAARLRALRAVVGKDEPDPGEVAPDQIRGEDPDATVGGVEQETKEEHAAKVKAEQGKG